LFLTGVILETEDIRPDECKNTSGCEMTVFSGTHTRIHEKTGAPYVFSVSSEDEGLNVENARNNYNAFIKEILDQETNNPSKDPWIRVKGSDITAKKPGLYWIFFWRIQR